MKTVYISCSEVAAAVGRNLYQSQADLARKILDKQFHPFVSVSATTSTVPTSEPVSVAKYAVQQWIETNRETAVLTLAKEKMSHIEAVRSVRQKTHEQAEQLQRTAEHAVVTAMFAESSPPAGSISSSTSSSNQPLEVIAPSPSTVVEPLLRLDDVLSNERQKVETLTVLHDEQLKHKRRVDKLVSHAISQQMPSDIKNILAQANESPVAHPSLSQSPTSLPTETPHKLLSVLPIEPDQASISPQLIEKRDDLQQQQKQQQPPEQLSLHDQRQHQDLKQQERDRVLAEALQAQQVAELQHAQSKQALLEQAEKLRKLEEAAVEIAAIPAQLHQTISKMTGTLAEDAIVNSVEKDLAKPVKHRNTSIKYKAIYVQDGWRVLVGGKPDGLIIDSATGATTVVEVKNRQNRLFRKVPEYELVQVQVYLWLFSADVCTFRENFHGETWSTNIQHDSVDLESIRMKLAGFVKEFIVPQVSLTKCKSVETLMETI